jgi:hypothetical protein
LEEDDVLPVGGHAVAPPVVEHLVCRGPGREDAHAVISTNDASLVRRRMSDDCNRATHDFLVGRRVVDD